MLGGGDVPGEIGKLADGRQVLVAVGFGLVADTQDGDDQSVAEDRDHQFAQQRGVPLRQTAPVGQRGIVVVHYRAAQADAFHPHAGLGDIVMPALTLGPAIISGRLRGPRLQRQRLLISSQKVVEAEAAAGQRAHFVERGDQQFLQRAGRCALHQAQASRQDAFLKPARGNLGDAIGGRAGNRLVRRPDRRHPMRVGCLSTSGDVLYRTDHLPRCAVGTRQELGVGTHDPYLATANDAVLEWRRRFAGQHGLQGFANGSDVVGMHDLLEFAHRAGWHMASVDVKPARRTAESIAFDVPLPTAGPRQPFAGFEHGSGCFCSIVRLVAGGDFRVIHCSLPCRRSRCQRPGPDLRTIKGLCSDAYYGESGFA